MSPIVREPRGFTITYGRPPWPPELLAARIGDIVTIDDERLEFRGMFTRPRNAGEDFADGPLVLVVGLRELDVATAVAVSDEPRPTSDL